MQGPIRCVLVTGLLIGCSGGDDVPDLDGAVGGGGVVVQWASKPDGFWPLGLEDGFTLDRATFALDSLRIVGDSGPGDPRTTASALTIRWDMSSTPATIDFNDAPSGLYSQVSVLADGHLTTDTFALRGHVRVSGTEYEYRIDGDNPLSVTIGIDRTLTPPATTTLNIAIDFKHALEAIDWSVVRFESGALEIDDTDAVMATVRTKLVESFSVDGQTGTIGVR